MSNDALGLERGRAIVVPYDPRWPVLFEEVAARLRDVLGDRILGIEHVGSTAVPGLPAKPILDILVAVGDFHRARQLIGDLEPLGFEYRPDEDIPDRHYFRKLAGTKRTHHLSLAEPGSSYYRKTIVFRDALRADPRLARRYGELKLELARRHHRDRESYLNGKTEFVLEVLRMHGVDGEATRRL